MKWKGEKPVDYEALCNIDLISPDIDRKVRLKELIPVPLQGGSDARNEEIASEQDAETGEKYPPIQGALIHLLRRGSCPLCKVQAEELNKRAEEFRKLGFKLIILLQDRIKVSEVVKVFDKGEVWIDPDLVSFKVLGRGKLIRPPKKQYINLGFLQSIHRQMSTQNVSFLEATILHGYIVIWKNKITYDHRQKVFEDVCSVDDILAECKKATEASP